MTLKDFQKSVQNLFKKETLIKEGHCEVTGHIVSFDMKMLNADEVDQISAIYKRLVEIEKDEFGKAKEEDFLKGLK